MRRLINKKTGTADTNRSRFLISLTLLRLPEQKLKENSSCKRLYEEELAEECHGDIPAQSLEHFRQQGEHMEAFIIRVVEYSGEAAHHGTHDRGGAADDYRFHEKRVYVLRIAYCKCDLHGKRTADQHIQCKCDADFDKYHSPYRKIMAEHINASHHVYRFDNAVRAGYFLQCFSFQDVYGIKDKNVYRNKDCDKRINGFLKFVLEHRFSPFLCFLTQKTHLPQILYVTVAVSDLRAGALHVPFSKIVKCEYTKNIR